MRRRLVKLAVFLLLGAIVNIAVAWTCTLVNANAFDVLGRLVAPPRNQHRPWDALTADEKSVVRSAGWPAPTDDGLIMIWAGTLQHEFFGLRETTYQPFVEMRDRVMSTGEYAYGQIASADRGFVARIIAGWPFKSLCEAQFYYPSNAPVRIEHADSLKMPNIAGMFPPVYGYFVPSRPIWPGFAINTVFYAGLLWLLFAAPFALRRWRRTRRGLCPACAYPVGDNPVCTECGKPLVKQKAETQKTEIT